MTDIYNFPSLSVLEELSSQERLCLYSNGNYIGDFASMDEINDYLLHKINIYSDNPKNDFNSRKYSVLPSTFFFIR